MCGASEYHSKALCSALAHALLVLWLAVSGLRVPGGYLGADPVGDDVDVLRFQSTPGGFLDGLLGCETCPTLEPYSPGQVDKPLMAHLPTSATTIQVNYEQATSVCSGLKASSACHDLVQGQWEDLKQQTGMEHL